MIEQLFNNNRLKSLLWRTFMMAFAGALAFLAENIGVLDLSTEMTVLLGLIFGEISKAINRYSHETI